MAERVKVVARASGRSVLLDARVARVLVERGTHDYAVEESPAKPAKKRTYKRRDMKAEE